MTFEKMPQRKRLSADEVAKLQNEWEAKLAAEGAPAELDPEVDTEGHSQAYDDALRNIELYFLMDNSASRANYGIHKVKMEGIISEMKAQGATEGEVSDLQLNMDDYARGIEDAVAELVLSARRLTQEQIEHDGIARHGLSRIIYKKLKESHPPLHDETLRQAADMAIEQIGF